MKEYIDIDESGLPDVRTVVFVKFNGTRKPIGKMVQDVDGQWLWFPDEGRGGWAAHHLSQLSNVLYSLNNLV
jgi:hypothetical protein